MKYKVICLDHETFYAPCLSDALNRMEYYSSQGFTCSLWSKGAAEFAWRWAGWKPAAGHKAQAVAAIA